MTTRLEIERVSGNRYNIVKKRELIAELEDRTGEHETNEGTIGLAFGRIDHEYGNNNDLFLHFGKSTLFHKVLAHRRRISVGQDNGKGAQQIAKDVTLFVSTGLR